jgi:hypothetical protein
MSTTTITTAITPVTPATDRLIQLHNGGVDFVLLGDGAAGYRWYLPNPDGPEEVEDWIFHALKHGSSHSLPEAVDALATAAAARFPDSAFAKGYRP